MLDHYYIGCIASEAYGYTHLLGQPAIVQKQHPLLPLVCIDTPGEALSIWIHKADLVPTGAVCQLHANVCVPKLPGNVNHL
jgi:hypothetical protein